MTFSDKGLDEPMRGSKLADNLLIEVGLMEGIFMTEYTARLDREIEGKAPSEQFTRGIEAPINRVNFLH